MHPKYGKVYESKSDSWLNQVYTSVLIWFTWYLSHIFIRSSRCARRNFHPDKIRHCGVMVLGLCKNWPKMIVRLTFPSVSTWFTWNLAQILYLSRECAKNNFYLDRLCKCGVIALGLSKNGQKLIEIETTPLVLICCTWYLAKMLTMS